MRRLRNQICNISTFPKDYRTCLRLIELLLIPSICTAKTIFNGEKVEILLKLVDIQNIKNPKLK